MSYNDYHEQEFVYSNEHTAYGTDEFSYTPQFETEGNFYTPFANVNVDNTFYQPAPDFHIPPISELQALVPSDNTKITKTNTKSQTTVSRPRPVYRAKTPWTIDENRFLFQAMAEYIYVDKNGMKPLAIYLNPAEIDHVESCENAMTMTDDDIARSLREMELDNNPNRRGDLLFAVVRHLQAASGYHSTRVVNEKIKNVRSRIINWFMTMYIEGAVPTKRPMRYIAAIVNSIIKSPFSILDPNVSTFHTNSAYADNKHDVCIWLDAMFWLYPKNMYDFVCQCAVQIVKAHVDVITAGYYDENLMAELSQASPNMSVIVNCLNLLINAMNSEERSKKNKSKSKGQNEASEDAFNKKRKRKTSANEIQRKTPGGDVEIMCNDNKVVSLSMFDMLKNEEKLQIAGMRVKMIAAVGGTIRNMDPMTSLDIKYNLYRLWTCVSHFSDVGSKLVNGAVGGIELNTLSDSCFAEFVVVNHFSQTFSDAIIEPRIRVSKRRFATGQFTIEQLIENEFTSTENENRHHIPVWLTVCRRSDDRLVLGLIITDVSIVAPVDMQLGGTSFRRFTDDQLLLVIDNALSSSGNVPYNGIPMFQNAGLEPWPWTPSQAGNISMVNGYEEQVDITVDNGRHVMVSTGWPNVVHTISAWAEPRVLSVEAYRQQVAYANMNIVDVAPSYSQFMQNENNIASRIDTSTQAMLNSNLLQQPLMDKDDHMLTYVHSNSLQQQEQHLQPQQSMGSNEYADGQVDVPHLMTSDPGLLLANSPMPNSQFSFELLSNNNSNVWDTGNNGYPSESNHYSHFYQDGNGADY